MSNADVSDNPNPSLPRVHELEIRVRYQETDAQGRVHHANYINYFEVGRIEMLRASGVDYRGVEEDGWMLVVAEVKCNYYVGAKFDDLLRLKTSVVRARGVRVTHHYELRRGDELMCDGETTVVAVNHDGKVVRLPKWLQLDRKPRH